VLDRVRSSGFSGVKRCCYVASPVGPVEVAYGGVVSSAGAEEEVVWVRPDQRQNTSIKKERASFFCHVCALGVCKCGSEFWRFEKFQPDWFQGLPKEIGLFHVAFLHRIVWHGRQGTNL
jgi:hypothetical protein